MNFINKLKKIYFLSKLTLKYIKILRTVKENEYKKLNDIKYQFTEDFLNFLNIDLKIHLNNNLGNPIQNNNNLFIINHRSLLDIVVIENILYHLKPKEINNFWIAKKELKKVFLLGSFFTEVKSNIFIDREDPSSSKEMFKICKEKIKEGNSNICIFPEGTRNKTSEIILPFKKGADLLAKMNKMNVIPIYISNNTSDILINKNSNEKIILDVYIGNNLNFENLEYEYKKFIDNINE